MVSRFVCSALFTVGLLISASAIQAQDILEQVYGSGVHAYFAGQLEKAQLLFDEVINAGSQDPRVYYFRGLTQIQSQGGCIIEVGLPDFEQAARLEVLGKVGVNVNLALARVQGPTRIAIERLRAEARMAAKILQVEEARAKYGEAGAPPNSQVVVPPVAVPTKPANDPFADGRGMTGGEPTPMPAGDAPVSPANVPANDPFSAPSSAPSNDPFKDDSAPSPAPANSADPFGL
jgi:hypothetical protein